MDRLKRVINNNLSGRQVLVWVIVTNLVFALMLLVTIPRTVAFANGMKLLDLMPGGYDFEYVRLLLDTLGEEGRGIYLNLQIPVDMIYPFLFGVSNCLLLAFVLKKLNKLDSFLFYFCLFPMIGAVADYLENIGIITMLRSYPDLSEKVVRVTNGFTLCKSISSTIYFTVLTILLVSWGVKSIASRR